MTTQPHYGNVNGILSVDEAVNRIGIGNFQHRILFATGTCFMGDSMQVMLLAFLSRILLDKWAYAVDDDGYDNGYDDEENVEFSASITSFLFAGSTVGTLILGPLGDRIGRKPVLWWSGFIISIAGLGTSLCTGYTSFIPVLFMVGFGIGGLTVPFDILAEFLPSEERGRYLLYIKYFWTLGCMIVPPLGYLSLEILDSWRLFAAFCTVPCIISTAIGARFVPESPRWLVSQGRTEEALEILRYGAMKNGLNPDVVFPNGSILADEEKEESSFAELLSPKWRKLTLLLWVVWGGYAYSYYAAIMTVTRIFDEEDDNDGPDFDYTAIFISSCAEVVGTTIAISQVDVLGRRPTIVLAFTLAGISLFFLCILSGHVARIVLIALAFSARASEMAGACVVWISTAELLSTEIRATGHSAANAVARIGGVLSPILAEGGSSIVMIGFVLLAVNIATAICSFLLPETKGIALGKAALLKEEEKHIPPIS